MQFYDSAGWPSEAPQTRSRIRVEGRDDAGEVVDPGKNVGTMYCVGVHFPSTGEVAYYDQKRVRPAEGQ